MAIQIKKGTYVPTRKTSVNDESYKQIAEAFNALQIGEFVEISNEDVKSSSLEASIRDFVTLKDGEHMRISRVKEVGNDNKSRVTALRLIKTNPPQPKKSKEVSTQGEA